MQQIKSFGDSPFMDLHLNRIGCLVCHTPPQLAGELEYRLADGALTVAKKGAAAPLPVSVLKDDYSKHLKCESCHTLAGLGANTKIAQAMKMVYGPRFELLSHLPQIREIQFFESQRQKALTNTH